MKLYKGYQINRDGRIYNKDKSLKKFHKNSSGYYVVDIYEKGIRQRWLVHRLIATLFVDNPKKEKVINHIDGNKLNNHYTNLEWTNHSYNNKHSYDIGLKTPTLNPKFNAKLSAADVRLIKRKLNTGKVNQAELGRTFGVSRYTINKIKIGETWKDVI